MLRNDIKFSGDNNIITFRQHTRLKNCKFIVRGNNHRLIIENDCIINNSVFWFEGNNCTIRIGKETTIEGANLIAVENDTKIDIAEDCMISHNVEIRTGDSHCIYDLDSNLKINDGKNVIIHEHVWIGAYVRVLKGVEIESNSVISMGTILTKNVYKNTIVGGVPNKILRENIGWIREQYM